MRTSLLTPLLLSSLLAACAVPDDAEVGADAGVDDPAAAGVAEPARTPAPAPTLSDARTRRPVPDTTITSGPSGGVASSAAAFTFTSTRTGSTFQCKLDAGAWTSCTSPRAYAGLVSGSHSFSVRACTSSCDATPAVRTWTVDTTPPTVTITSGPAAVTNSAVASFAFVASEPGTSQCQLDGGAYAACTSPRSYGPLADGAHTLAVRACDAVGNCGAASMSWTIDTIAPTVTITSGPANPSSTTSATFTFATAGSPAIVQCNVDSGAFAACTSPVAYAALAAGAHLFTARACDAAGNCGAVSYAWTIASSTPTVTITSAPTNPSALRTPTFAFTSTGAATSQCSVDGNAYASCVSPTSVGPLADGAHAFSVRACDLAGTCAVASYTWSIDTIAPTIVITSGPTNPSTSLSATFTFATSGGATSTQCRMDAGAYVTCTSPTSYAALASGAHVFSARACDAAGNCGAASSAWTIAP